MSTKSPSPVAPTIPGPIADTRKPQFVMPRGTCDCHAHLFGPQSKYAYAADRRYTPPDATADDYIRMLRLIGVERAVLVQPSVYMTDNAVILDALAENKFPFRAVAVINDGVTDAELARMHALGVRGLRLNLRNANGVPGDLAPRIAGRIAKYGWHLQFRINAEDFVSIGPMLRALPVDFVIDHMGQVPVADGVNGAAFSAILKLAQDGRCWVKLSAPMRMSARAYPYPDVTPFVHALVAANPDRMLWASDWPHTTLTCAMPNDGDLVDLLPTWLPDAAVRQKILVDNPARLYGF
jgi:predicted TIM-barrel fold metal-dependent hydrolase